MPTPKDQPSPKPAKPAEQEAQSGNGDKSPGPEVHCRLLEQVLAARSPVSLAQDLAQSFVELFNFKAWFLATATGMERFQPVACSTGIEDLVDLFFQQSPAEEVALLLTDQPQLIDLTTTTPPLWSAAVHEGFSRCVCLPLSDHDQRIGSLIMLADADFAVQPANLAFMSGICLRAGRMLRLLEQTQHDAALAEQTLENEERCRLAIEATGLGTWDFNIPSDKLICSDHFKQIFGLGPEAEIDYYIFLGLLHPDDRMQTHRLMQQALEPRGNGEYSTEFRAIWPDGTVHWVAAQGQAFFATIDDRRRPVRLIGTSFDITELKQADAIAEQKTPAFSTIMINLPGFAYRYGNGMAPNLEFVSEGIGELTGYQPADVTGGTAIALASLIHPDDHDNVWNEIFQALHDRRKYQCVYRLRHRNGEEKWLLDQGLGIYNEHGEPIAIEGFATDITERKQTQDALRDSEERLRLALESAFMTAWDWDPQTDEYIQAANAEQVLGLRVTTGRQFFSLVHPDDQAALKSTISEAMDRGGEYIAQYRLAATEDRRARWMEDRAKVYCDSRGRVLRVGGITSEITERLKAEESLRRSEEAYRAIFESAGSGKVQIDPRTRRFLLVNQKYCDLTGYNEEELQKMTASTVTHPDDRERDQTSFERLVNGETTEYFIEKRYVRKDGRVIWVHATATLVRDPGGRPSRVLTIVNDVTESKRFEEETRDSERQFRLLTDVIPQLVWTAKPDGMLDYCNPRWLIYTGLMLEQIEGKEWYSAIHPGDRQACKNNWEKAIKQAAEFQAQARLRDEAGNYRWFLLRALPLRGEIRQVIKWFGTCTDIDQQKQTENLLQENHERLEMAASAANIGSWEWDPSTGQLTWDERCQRIHGLPAGKIFSYQDFLNHILPEDKETTAEAMEKAYAGGGNVECEYRIAWPDQSVHGVMAKGRVMNKADGQPGRIIGIALESAHRPQPVDAKKMPKPYPLPEETELLAGDAPVEYRKSRARKKVRVLLVDDHHLVREGLRSVIEDCRDFEVVGEAGDGLEAVKLTRQLLPDAVVMDVNMPKMNGIEATGIIKAEMPEITVIGLSVNEDRAVSMAMRAAGATAFLSKGGPSEELCQTIREAHRRRP